MSKAELSLKDEFGDKCDLIISISVDSENNTTLSLGRLHKIVPGVQLMPSVLLGSSPDEVIAQIRRACDKLESDFKPA
jgi:hypothetical protein